jgi:hypothetical protein
MAVATSIRLQPGALKEGEKRILAMDQAWRILIVDDWRKLRQFQEKRKS